jgi:hypothetical protein
MQSDWLNDDPPAPPPRRRWRAIRCHVFYGAAAIVFGGALLCWNDPRARFWLKSDAGSAAGANAKPLVGAAALPASDPALRFSKTHVGQVVFSRPNSDTCRRVLFDNRTGLSYWVDDLKCGRTAEQPIEDESPDRMTAVRNSFQR